MTTDLIKADPRSDDARTAGEVGSPDRECEVRARLGLRRRVTLASIVGLEAVVLLAILATLARGPADHRQSAWTLAGLSFLFLVLSQFRRRATASAPDA
jgi:hypothetical protein